jgi:hypothetical protein
MPMLRLRKLGAVLIICGACSLAYPGQPFNLQTLVEKAEVVAVVDIFEIDDAGPASVNFDGRAILASAYRADVRLVRRIKGASPDSLIVDFFTPQQFVGYPGVAIGRQMIFVKRQGSTYEFADRCNGSRSFPWIFS